MVASSDCVAVIVPEIKEKQLILPEKTEGLTLAHYVPVLQQYRDVNKALVFDYRDKQGNAAARSHVAKLRRIKAPLGEIHKRLKAEYLAITTKMDADKKDALSIVEEMIEHHDKELRVVAVEEAAEIQRKKDEQDIVDNWDLAHEMNAMFDQQKALDRQQGEQERVAKEQADALQKIEQDKREKEIREQAVADFARQTEERAERDRKAEAERKRQTEANAAADLENIKRVHWAIIPAMVAHGITEEQAKDLILAIRDGKVPAVSINYQWGVQP